MIKMDFKKLNKSQVKKLAEKAAGPKKEWIIDQERKVYIRGVIDGINAFQNLGKKASKHLRQFFLSPWFVESFPLQNISHNNLLYSKTLPRCA
jgi:trehalose-6-phosphate synthase